MKVPHVLSAAALNRNARFIKPALIVLIAVDLLALAAFSVRLDSVTTTTSVPGPPPAAVLAPVTAPPAAPVPPALPAVSVGVGGTPISTPAKPSPTPSKPAAPVTPEPTDPAEPTEPGSVKIARCVIPIKEPTTSGGLQTLIGFAPAFGPFKAEAFAPAAAYQPLLQLLGPILAKYPEIAPKIEPALTPLLDTFAALLDQGFNLIAPLYSPYRQSFLEAEGKLAAALAPYSQKLAASPLGGCIVELQAALLEDSTPTARTVAAK
ncbi:hypothetical protein ABIE44_000457 [Marmoricola sp. OAE513]|uniref:hypothetical protein n=1 Tax=Marmoricola sp. OAE513 TaxID=2817894 RepID=UPI001AE518CD